MAEPFTPPSLQRAASDASDASDASQQQPAATTMRVVAFCLVLLSALAGFAALVYLEDILIPFTFAFFLACVLEPLQQLVIRTGMVAGRACGACGAGLRSQCESDDAQRGTAAERESLTGTHVQLEAATSDAAPRISRRRRLGASEACGHFVLRMTGVVVCVLSLLSCLTGFVAVSTFELERLAALAETQNWDRRGEELVNETIRLVNRTHLPPSQIEGYLLWGTSRHELHHITTAFWVGNITS